MWPYICVFFSIRYGLFGHKYITIKNDINAIIVKDPFCDYLLTPDEKKCYMWSFRPIKLEKY